MCSSGKRNCDGWVALGTARRQGLGAFLSKELRRDAGPPPPARAAARAGSNFLSVSAAEEAGQVELALGTVTPDFDTFLASVDGGEWQPCGAKFPWRLHHGQNRVELRIRNRAGVLGMPSAIEVRYTGK